MERRRRVASNWSVRRRGQWFEFRNNITANRPELLVHLSIIEGLLQDQEPRPPRHLFSDKFWFPSSKLGSDGQAAAIGDVVQEREMSTNDIGVPRGGPVSCATPGSSGGELVVKKNLSSSSSDSEDVNSVSGGRSGNEVVGRGKRMRLITPWKEPNRFGSLLERARFWVEWCESHIGIPSNVDGYADYLQYWRFTMTPRNRKVMVMMGWHSDWLISSPPIRELYMLPEYEDDPSGSGQAMEFDVRDSDLESYESDAESDDSQSSYGYDEKASIAHRT